MATTHGRQGCMSGNQVTLQHQQRPYLYPNSRQQDQQSIRPSLCPPPYLVGLRVVLPMCAARRKSKILMDCKSPWELHPCRQVSDHRAPCSTKHSPQWLYPHLWIIRPPLHRMWRNVREVLAPPVGTQQVDRSVRIVGAH